MLASTFNEIVTLSGLTVTENFLNWVFQDGSLDLSECNLAGAELVDLEDEQLLADVTLNKAILTNAILRGVTLYNTKLIQANLADANLKNSHVSYTSFKEANMTNVNLKHSYISASFVKANLTGANLEYSRLDVADFTNANLTGSLFDQSFLTKTTKLNGIIFKDVVIFQEYPDYELSKEESADLIQERLEQLGF